MLRRVTVGWIISWMQRWLADRMLRCCLSRRFLCHRGSLVRLISVRKCKNMHIESSDHTCVLRAFSIRRVVDDGIETMRPMWRAHMPAGSPVRDSDRVPPALTSRVHQCWLIDGVVTLGCWTARSANGFGNSRRASNDSTLMYASTSAFDTKNGDSSDCEKMN